MPIAQTFQERMVSLTSGFRFHRLQTQLSSRPVAKVGKTPPAQSGWTTAMLVSLSAHSAPQRPRCRGHGFKGVGSGVRVDLASEQGLSSIHLGALGVTARQSSAWSPPIRALQCALGWDKASLTKGKATVDLRDTALPIFPSSSLQASGIRGVNISSQGEEMHLAGDEELQCFL